jgi:hypothetical protein
MNTNHSVWVYQINRKLNAQEEALILAKLQDFAQNWTAHQSPLPANVLIKYHQFIILTADESSVKASGCAIDSATHAMQDIEKEFNLNLFDRQLFTYKIAAEVFTLNATEFQLALDQGIINEDTLVFNNLVRNTEDLAKQWEVPLKNSWHRNLFNLKNESIEK